MHEANRGQNHTHGGQSVLGWLGPFHSHPALTSQPWGSLPIFPMVELAETEQAQVSMCSKADVPQVSCSKTNVMLLFLLGKLDTLKP